MKIYALTNVTELPKTCKECREKGVFVYGIKNEWTLSAAHCFYRETTVMPRNNRPIWCPLRTEQEIKEANNA